MGKTEFDVEDWKEEEYSNYSLQLMIEEIREPSEQSPCNVVVHCKSEIREMASWLK